MENNFYNLNKDYWEALQKECPGYVDDFLHFAFGFLNQNSISSMDDVEEIFYTIPFCFQSGIFYEYISRSCCSFESDPTDYKEVIDSIRLYFLETKENDLLEKSNDKSI